MTSSRISTSKVTGFLLVSGVLRVIRALQEWACVEPNPAFLFLLVSFERNVVGIREGR